MNTHVTVFSTEPLEVGKGGKGSDYQITNAVFVTAVFPTLPEGAFGAICSKSGDPGMGGWPASRAVEWVRCDPPPRHMAILYDAQKFRYLPALAGVVWQPYFREPDGDLITQAGCGEKAQRFGVFDARQFVIPDPTPGTARSALALLEDLLTEFHFVTATDKAAALEAILTAVVRPSLPYAPGFHARVPVFGSGKTYPCELIGAYRRTGLSGVFFGVQQ